MQPHGGAKNIRPRDVFTYVMRRIWPPDRPMPIFTMLAVIVNGVQLIYSFPVLLSLDCKKWMSQWCAIGTANTIGNMLYPIVLMWRFRRKIEEGIPTAESSIHLFVKEPTNIVFLLFLIWEILWMSHSPSLPDSSLSSGQCSHYVLFLIIFSSVWMFLLLLLVMFTFMTDFGRPPRWREWANERWRQRQEIFSLVHYGVPNPPENTRRKTFSETFADIMGTHTDLGPAQPDVRRG
ncbi:hypothetical protein DPX39_000053800 [Trypanosoma brucei equiperdum]|uniref:Uncharacterized protein n=1 Tax=Trypanosoma brucei equiperdum TaxID=630700 RepID=A0A3L6KRR4_9TRYP|nr:hypothetical protein DPX39_000053800 [Trypanosoma brucei equiperdum]